MRRAAAGQPAPWLPPCGTMAGQSSDTADRPRRVEGLKVHILRPPFRMEDTAAVAFAAKRGFGLVAASERGELMGSHVPFVVRLHEGVATVEFHVAATNPLARLAEEGVRFLIAVSGADAYVSNDWYASSDQVSTWLYEAVHLSGPARIRPLSGNRSHGDALLAAAEARLPKSPWTLASMEPGKRQAMLDAIRVVDVVVDRVEGQSKLNQHKADDDHLAVANRLARAPSAAAREIAAKMRALRPHLSYDNPE